jgi:EAL domain-containing protein (putative c-di-GMP-specific phosphodiesterase class I)
MFGRRTREERLLWSRDERFVAQVARAAGAGRLISVAAGAVLIGPGELLTDELVQDTAGATAFGLIDLDSRLSPEQRYVMGLAEAVQASGIADRVGMIKSPTSAYHKMMDLFLAHQAGLEIVYQPIVALRTLEVLGYEAFGRPPHAVGTIDRVVEAAVATNRTIDLDRTIAKAVLLRTATLDPVPPSITINALPASLQDDWFDGRALAERCRAIGLETTGVVFECTEQQSAPDLDALVKRVRQLRDSGFGFAIDDAGAGYASFALIAAVRPSLIKIDLHIVQGISQDDAKQALVEAFVSFARRLGSNLVAEGIEKQEDLQTLADLGVERGQGYLVGRPQREPAGPYRMRRRTTAAAGS